MKLNLNHILVAILLITITFFGIKTHRMNNERDRMVKEIIQKDVLVKEKDGQYKKVVDYLKSERDLKAQLKKEHLELYKQVKDKDDKILSLTNVIATLKGKKDTGTVIKNADSSYSFISYYPQQTDYFVKYSGRLVPTKKQVYGEWEFGQLAFDMVLTETKTGIWEYRLIGPEYLIVNKMEVNSLKPKEYSETKATKMPFMSPLVGMGYRKYLSDGTSTVTLNGGVAIMDKIYILGSFGLDNSADVGLMYKFK